MFTVIQQKKGRETTWTLLSATWMILLLGFAQSCYAQHEVKATVTKTTELKWYDAGLGGDIKISPVSGDIQKGEHSTIVRFPAGTLTPLHTQRPTFGIPKKY